MCETTEEEILKFFNSADGVCGNREPSIVVAVNSVCDNGNFQSQAHLICNVALYLHRTGAVCVRKP